MMTRSEVFVFQSGSEASAKHPRETWQQKRAPNGARMLAPGGTKRKRSAD
jgi:hypothetical protein